MSGIIEIMKALHAKKLEEAGKLGAQHIVGKPADSKSLQGSSSPANNLEEKPSLRSEASSQKVEKPSVAKESEKIVPNEPAKKSKSIKDFVSSLSETKYKGKK